MKHKKMKLVKAEYSYHPDFIEDKAEPNGYRILNTGRYVVEWSVRDVYVINPLKNQQYYKCSFLTPEEAERFVNKLYDGLSPNGTFEVIEDNKFYFGK